MAPTAIVVPVLEACASTGGGAARTRRTARTACRRTSRCSTRSSTTASYGNVTCALRGDCRRPSRLRLHARPIWRVPGSEGAPAVLYIAPEPDGPFRELTDALAQAFPEHPPYDGAFAEVVPHLTVAWHHDAPVDEIRADVAGASRSLRGRARRRSCASIATGKRTRARRSAIRTAGRRSRRRRGRTNAPNESAGTHGLRTPR